MKIPITITAIEILFTDVRWPLSPVQGVSEWKGRIFNKKLKKFIFCLNYLKRDCGTTLERFEWSLFIFDFD